MKFSILLPTRNGGVFLENCIRSILEQECDDFELIVSDNANTDRTPEVLRQFSTDPRVKIVRLETPVSVTENWNNALRFSRGDYILMMGDDDYLLPGSLDAMSRLLAKYEQPDCVVYNAYSYIAPGSINDNQQSFYGEEHFHFGADLKLEHCLSEAERFGIVQDMFRFKVRIPLNMQTTLVARRAFEQVGGGVFQAPFPDHYALNALLLTAQRWVFTPERFVIVGVSPKSFGHYVYSNHQNQGLAYLGIAADFPGRLPGNELMNGMHVWLNLLKQHYAVPLAAVDVDRAGYVRRQVYAWYMQRKLGAISSRDFFECFRLLSCADWRGLLASVLDGPSWRRLGRIVCARFLAMLRRRRQSDVQAQWHGLQALENIADIRQFAQWLAMRNQRSTL